MIIEKHCSEIVSTVIDSVVRVFMERATNAIAINPNNMLIALEFLISLSTWVLNHSAINTPFLFYIF